MTFCMLFQLTPVPTNEKTILLYIAYLQQKGVSYNAINVYISAVKNINIINGHDIPNFRSARVKLALRAIKANSHPPVQKCPITYDRLKIMWCSIELATHSLSFVAGTHFPGLFGRTPLCRILSLLLLPRSCFVRRDLLRRRECSQVQGETV